jgi:hypothetical protein
MPDDVFFDARLFLAIITRENMTLRGSAFRGRFRPPLVANEAAAETGSFADIQRLGPEDEPSSHENVDPATPGYLAVFFDDSETVAPSCFTKPVLASENEHDVCPSIVRVNRRCKSVNL